MPKVYSAPVGFEPPDFDDYFVDGKFDFNLMVDIESKYLEDLADHARSRNQGDLVGETIKFQRGDGYAQYMVWSQKPLSFIWIELGDAWTVEDALLRGLRVKDVREMVDADRAWAELFSRKD